MRHASVLSLLYVLFHVSPASVVASSPIDDVCPLFHRLAHGLDLLQDENNGQTFDLEENFCGLKWKSNVMVPDKTFISLSSGEYLDYAQFEQGYDFLLLRDNAYSIGPLRRGPPIFLSVNNNLFRIRALVYLDNLQKHHAVVFKDNTDAIRFSLRGAPLDTEVLTNTNSDDFGGGLLMNQSFEINWCPLQREEMKMVDFRCRYFERSNEFIFYVYEKLRPLTASARLSAQTPLPLENKFKPAGLGLEGLSKELQQAAEWKLEAESIGLVRFLQLLGYFNIQDRVTDERMKKLVELINAYDVQSSDEAILNEIVLRGAEIFKSKVFELERHAPEDDLSPYANMSFFEHFLQLQPEFQDYFDLLDLYPSSKDALPLSLAAAVKIVPMECNSLMKMRESFEITTAEGQTITFRLVAAIDYSGDMTIIERTSSQLAVLFLNNDRKYREIYNLPPLPNHPAHFKFSFAGGIAFYQQMTGLIDDTSEATFDLPAKDFDFTLSTMNKDSLPKKMPR